MPEITVWSEDPGVQLVAAPFAGHIKITILRNGQVIASAPIARYRWERVVQATLPNPLDLARMLDSLPEDATWSERIEHEVNSQFGGDATVGEIVWLMERLGWTEPD